ncbi:MAG: HAD family hydrolase [Muribaculaceae bacterium]|nr:HAD family hydrolase [Muribaculaceae bacterium]
MKQLVIFDLDGTLLNTISDLGQAANHALTRAGYPTHTLSSYPFFVGNGVKKLLERVLPDDARTEENIERLREYFTEYYDQHKTDHTEPYPGIPELLRNLQDKGVKLAVASNKYDSAVKSLISNYFPYISWAAVEGQKPDVPVKPDPSIVFHILSEIPTPKAEVLYVGDSGVDMETARRACVTSCGVTWGFRPESELKKNYAEIIVSNPAEILEIATGQTDTI